MGQDRRFCLQELLDFLEVATWPLGYAIRQEMWESEKGSRQREPIIEGKVGEKVC